MGKQFYRQKVGIPQGSVVSTVLCNIFYANLEKKKLPFLTDVDGLLLRLIDDFLFISMNRDHAQQFLQYMHDGNKK
jgi:telomerase reverse transcriptase